MPPKKWRPETVEGGFIPPFIPIFGRSYPHTYPPSDCADFLHTPLQTPYRHVPLYPLAGQAPLSGAACLFHFRSTASGADTLAPMESPSGCQSGEIGEIVCIRRAAPTLAQSSRAVRFSQVRTALACKISPLVSERFQARNSGANPPDRCSLHRPRRSRTPLANSPHRLASQSSCADLPASRRTGGHWCASSTTGPAGHTYMLHPLDEPPCRPLAPPRRSLGTVFAPCRPQDAACRVSLNLFFFVGRSSSKMRFR